MKKEPENTSKPRRKKNRRTLKKKIRRIIYIVILFIFILLGIVQSWFAYGLIKMGTLYIADIIGKSCAVLIDTDQLKEIRELNDFGRPEYEEVSKTLKQVFPTLWNIGQVRFTIIKEVNGLMVSVVDSQDRIFTTYGISRDNLRKLHDPRFNEQVAEVKGLFHITAYTPIRDEFGRLQGVFAARIDPLVLQAVFVAIVVIIIILSIIGYTFSLIITRIMTMRITKPLEVLNDRIRLIARAEGDLSQRITFPKTYKEVEELAEGTNLVMESMERFVRLLEEKQYRVEEKNRELASQAEELEAQTEELMALNESLEDAMRKLQDAQVQLVQSEKMASLGQLTAGVAHEINTPLGAINSNINIIEMVIEFLKADLDLDHNDKARSLVNRVEKANDTNKLAVERIMQIVRHLKNFSRLDESDFKEADLHEGIDSVLILSHNLIKHRIHVTKEYAEIPLVRCFPNLLNQVFMNIIVNAAQAIPEKGNILIKTWIKEKRVFIQIKDDGVGIPKENFRKIFDPGFTTKGVGVGTGLGLSICYKIIEKHHGKIEVESEVGRGTTFTIEVPINNTFEQVRDRKQVNAS